MDSSSQDMGKQPVPALLGADCTTLRVTAPPILIEAATRLLLAEVPNFYRYNRLGWGWGTYCPQHPRAKFFVRRTKDGLSITAYASVGAQRQDGPSSGPGINPDLPLPTQQGSDT